MRIKTVVANWKMNLLHQDALNLVNDIIAYKKKATHTAIQIIICPAFVHIASIKNQLSKENSSIIVGAQNCHQKSNGAFTGEVSAAMLHDLGVQYVLIGHSERRQYADESNKLIRTKINQVLQQGIQPIFCCGEPLIVRDQEGQYQFVLEQLIEGLFHLSKDVLQKIIIAYEPVWAIGTGKTATPAQAQAMHIFIRRQIAQKYGETVASTIIILYGGSCHANNASSLFACPDIDGGLIGSASLKYPDFVKILQSFP